MFTIWKQIEVFRCIGWINVINVNGNFTGYNYVPCEYNFEHQEVQIANTQICAYRSKYEEGCFCASKSANSLNCIIYIYLTIHFSNSGSDGRVIENVSLFYGIMCYMCALEYRMVVSVNLRHAFPRFPCTDDDEDAVSWPCAADIFNIQGDGHYHHHQQSGCSIGIRWMLASVGYHQHEHHNTPSHIRQPCHSSWIVVPTLKIRIHAP